MSPRKRLTQQWMYFATLTVCSSNLSMALAAAWTSPTLGLLMEGTASGIHSLEAMVLNVLLPAGGALACLLSRLVIDRTGRKQAVVLGAGLFLSSWTILALFRSLLLVCVARFVAGLACGTLYLASGIYVAEVAPREVRQVLFAVSQVFTNLGFVIEYCLGPYIPYTTLVLVSGTPSLVFFICSFFVPESPYYLVSKGYYEEAKATLIKLRGTSDVAVEFKAIQESIGECERTALKDLASDTNRRALWLSSGAMVVKQMTGSWAIVSFAGPLIADGGIPLGPGSFIVGASKLVTSAVTIFLVLKYGIKRLVVLSLVGVTVSLGFLLGFFVCHNKLDYTMDGYLWVPIFALILYFVFTDFGIGPFPSYIGAELFSQKAKGAGTSIALTVSHLVSMCTIVLLTRADVVISLGLFTVFTACSIPLIARYLVETKGMSLAEIQTGGPPKEELNNHI